MDEIEEIKVKKVLKPVKFDSWFLVSYTLNPYISCSFSCIYCYVKHSKYGKERKIKAKINTPEVLEKELVKELKKEKSAELE